MNDKDRKPGTTTTPEDPPKADPVAPAPAPTPAPSADAGILVRLARVESSLNDLREAIDRTNDGEIKARLEKIEAETEQKLERLKAELRKPQEAPAAPAKKADPVEEKKWRIPTYYD